MSTTGARDVGQPTADALKALRDPMPTTRAENIEEAVRRAHVTSGPLIDAEFARLRAEREFDRCFHPLGMSFQMTAIVASGDRTAALASVATPTTVVHGDADPLIPLTGGEATAAAIPGAELVVLEGMGHNYPPRYHARYVAELDRLVARALR
jgi:pimeloyl-ACP methyl ester carboxylesterase